ncbi:PIN domain-containing protein [Haemophilus haemolyticus]|jgi:hypothetical protein|uniref:PIN domain-containing protein n=2 Tax=Haemophilus TaxID=724 RepID=UPI000E5685BB|nr:PIN domain-containing protein [Haemophilus haemolyticus]
MTRKYDVISLDTNILVRAGFDFQSGILPRLKQFKDSDVKILVTDIVHRESIKHLSKKISDDYFLKASSIKEHLKKFNRYNPFLNVESISNQLDVLLGTNRNIHEIAEECLVNFYQEIDAKIIDCNNVSIEKLTNMYFSSLPPFGGKDKKSEFPDAIALLSLDDWAKRNCLDVLFVSNENGVKNYKSEFGKLSIIEDLPLALRSFQPIDLIIDFENKFKLKPNSETISEVFYKIETELTEEQLSINANSSFDFEIDSVEIANLNVNFGKNSDINFDVVWITNNQVSISFSALATFDVMVSADFFYRDPIDKDYHHFGNNSFLSSEELEIDIIVDLDFVHKTYFNGNIDSLSISEIDVNIPILNVDLGFIEPELI